MSEEKHVKSGRDLEMRLMQEFPGKKVLLTGIIYDAMTFMPKMGICVTNDPVVTFSVEDAQDKPEELIESVVSQLKEQWKGRENV